jgi:hypothetical protein
MSDTACALAAETRVETPEGPLAIRTVAGKAIPVFTREADRVRFRMMLDVRKLAEQQPVLEITLETGAAFRVAPQQILFKKGMVECRADALRVGDLLVPVFHYPEHYAFTDDGDGTVKASSAGLSVVAIEPAGTADIYTFGVNRTGCFFLSAGVLGKADGDQPRPPTESSPTAG